MKQKNFSTPCYLVLDVGTTGLKAFVFDSDERVLARVYKPLKKYFPKSGWVEQSPIEYIQVAVSALREAVKKSKIKLDHLSGFGLTNQRETTIIWSRITGQPIHPAIVWEDQRTAKRCQEKPPSKLRLKTGLSLNSYFSATKIEWLLNSIPSARERAELGELAFGTVDSWMLWGLSLGRLHLIDETNASRTLLFDIKKRHWDQNLLKYFSIPGLILPRVVTSRGHFGELDKSVVGKALPILAVCGDQQASLFAAGQSRGTTKVTLGTGGFIMQDLGSKMRLKDGWMTTLTPGRKRSSFALEHKIEQVGVSATRLLNKPKQLEAYVTKLVRTVARAVKALPTKPRVLVLDGGVSQHPLVAPLLEKATGIKVKKHAMHDGTALGVLRMMK